MSQDSGGEPIAVLLSRVALAVEEQVAVQVELVKAELVRDVGELGRDVAPLGAGSLLLAIAYLLLCSAGAHALAVWIGVAGGFATLGLVNLIIGAVAIRGSLGRLRARRTPTPPELRHVR